MLIKILFQFVKRTLLQCWCFKWNISFPLCDFKGWARFKKKMITLKNWIQGSKNMVAHSHEKLSKYNSLVKETFHGNHQKLIAFIWPCIAVNIKHFGFLYESNCHKCYGKQSCHNHVLYIIYTWHIFLLDIHQNWKLSKFLWIIFLKNVSQT